MWYLWLIFYKKKNIILKVFLFDYYLHITRWFSFKRRWQKTKLEWKTLWRIYRMGWKPRNRWISSSRNHIYSWKKVFLSYIFVLMWSLTNFFAFVWIKSKLFWSHIVYSNLLNHLKLKKILSFWFYSKVSSI